VLKLIITATALYLVFRKIDFEKVLLTYNDSNILLLFTGLVMFIISQVVSSYRLNRFLGAGGVKISEMSNMKLFLLGMYYNLFLPGGIGGDGYKIYLLNKTFSVKAKSLFWALLLDRVNGLTALVSLGSVLVLFVEPFGRFRFFAVFIMPVALIALYIITRKFFNNYVRILPATLMQSFAKAILQVVCACFILLSFGSHQQWFPYLFLFLVSSIVAMFPITIGGIGAREVTFLYGAEILSLDVNTALAVSFMFYLMTVLVSFTGIYFSFKTERLNINITTG